MPESVELLLTLADGSAITRQPNADAFSLWHVLRPVIDDMVRSHAKGGAA